MALLARTATLVLLLALVAASAEGRTMRSLLQTPGTLPPVFLDEIHWDNAALDFGEAVEIFGPAGTNLAGWTVTRYLVKNNGNLCTNADTSQQSAGVNGPCGAGNPFTIPAQTTIPSQTVVNGIGYGTVVVFIPNNGLVNGGAAVVLANAAGVVQDYLFYGSVSTLALVGGPANGLTVTNNIGAAENGAGPIGNSIQRFGPTTFDTTTNGAANTFGTAYQAYLPVSANPGGVPNSNLDPNTGLVNFPAGTTTAAGTTPLEPPSWNNGPIILSPGGLPTDPTVLANLILDSTPTGTTAPVATTPAPTTAAPATPAPTTKAPTPGPTTIPPTPTPTTPGSTTPAPTTPAPTTKSPTPAPTTASPTTPAPTTAAPTTPAPTTPAPTTPAPTTKAPTPAPTTLAPTTPAPTTPAPTTPAPTTPAPTTKSPTPAPTTPAPTTAAPTTPAPTTPAATTPAPTSGIYSSPSAFTCAGLAGPGLSNPCFNNDGSKFVCCAGACAPGTPGPTPACAGGPTSAPVTPSPTTPAATTPAPTTPAATTPAPTPGPTFATASGATCNAYSANPYSCYSSDGATFACCPTSACAPGGAACAGAAAPVPITTAAPVPTTAAPVPTTAAPVPTFAVFPTGTGNGCNPVGQYQCFNGDGSLYTCCIAPQNCAPGTPGPVPACA